MLSSLTPALSQANQPAKNWRVEGCERNVGAESRFPFGPPSPAPLGHPPPLAGEGSFLEAERETRFLAVL